MTEHPAGDTTGVRTVVVVRHALAVPRTAWSGDDDRRRPLRRAGRERASELVTLLCAVPLRRIVSSPSTRCAATVAPTADALGIHVEWAPPLSEEGHESDPGSLAGVLDDALTGVEPVALCSHGPVLPDLFRGLLDRHRPGSTEVDRVVAGILKRNLAKGEAVVLRISPAGPIVDAARHRP